MGRSILSVCFALLLALLLVAPAEAHAYLVHSEPAAGATIQTTPRELVLEFSEELDPSFSSVQLFNSKHQIINPGPGSIDPAKPTVLRLTLGNLPKDSYTAIWHSRSAIDGHVAEGNLPFGIGVAVSTASLLPPVGAPDPATTSPPPLDSALRWFSLVAVAIMLGGLPFGLLVWRPALQQNQYDHTDLANADILMTKTIQNLLLLGSIVLVLTNILFLVVQAAEAAQVPITQVFGTPLIHLLSGRSGQIWLARLVLAIILGLIARRLPLAAAGSTRLWWSALVLSSALLLTFSLQSHGAAAAQQAPLAVALDWLHITAMVAWVGGLIPLFIAIRAARRMSPEALPFVTLIPRFSRLALISIVVLALTGLYSYLLNINQLDLLLLTTYGRALLIKLGLFVLLLLLGGTNLILLSPRLRQHGNKLATAFGRTVRVELVAGVLVLLAVGVMTSIEPSKAAWAEHERLGILQQTTTNDVNLALRVAPAQIGENEFAVDVTDHRPGAKDAPAKVLLRFNMLGMNMGTLQAETQTNDTQRFTTQGNYTSMGGRWQVQVILRRAGFDDVTHTFEVDIVRSATIAS